MLTAVVHKVIIKTSAEEGSVRLNSMPLCVYIFTKPFPVPPDCGCLHGVQPDPAVYVLLTRCTEEQQAHGRTAADTTAGNEFGPCTTGQFF